MHFVNTCLTCSVWLCSVGSGDFWEIRERSLVLCRRGFFFVSLLYFAFWFVRKLKLPTQSAIKHRNFGCCYFKPVETESFSISRNGTFESTLSNQICHREWIVLEKDSAPERVQCISKITELLYIVDCPVPVKALVPVMPALSITWQMLSTLLHTNLEWIHVFFILFVIPALQKHNPIPPPYFFHLNIGADLLWVD